MSAERKVFKDMDALIAEKELFQQQYMERGTTLVKTAVREFMLEHPKVLMLFWRTKPDRCWEKYGYPLQLRVVMKVKGEEIPVEKTWSGLKEMDLQLSQCLEAMETKFKALWDIVVDAYGEDASIHWEEFAKQPECGAV